VLGRRRVFVRSARAVFRFGRVAGGAGYVEPDLGAQLVTPSGSPALEPLSERDAT
jgi:hypothetical protein